MKRIALVLMIALSVVGMAAARPLNALEEQLDNAGATQVSLTGTLTLMNGSYAFLTDSRSYFLSGVNNFNNFVEGFRAGAKVTVDGYVASSTLYVTAITVNGVKYPALDIQL
jgi:hypothetical protein